MVNLEPNTLYIILGVVVIAVIVIAVLLIRRRRSGSRPSNPNQFLAEETQNKKLEIAKRAGGIKTPKPLYMFDPEDEIEEIRGITSDIEHKNIYFNLKIDEKVDRLKKQYNLINLKKQIKMINKKSVELNSTVQSKDK